MSIIDSISGWWKQEQQNWALLPVTAPPALPQLPAAIGYGQNVNPHQAYVTVRMRSMAVTATRAGWSRFHAALYTQASLGMKDGSIASIQSVLSPDFLRDLDPKRIQNVLQIDRTIFGPVPYIGTKITFASGVFAVKHADLAAPFLTCLTDLASAAGVGLISVAKPFIEPIKSGIELLTGTKDATSLEIALFRELQPPQTGWYALVRVPGQNVNASELTVRPTNFELLRQGRTMPGVPYLLFSIEANAEREDWAQIPELKAAYADFAKAGDEGNQNDANEAVKLFARRARLSPELLRTHVDDVIAAIEDEFKKLFPGGGTAGPERAAKGAASAKRDLSNLIVRFRQPQ
jgi:hypothetical protein